MWHGSCEQQFLPAEDKSCEQLQSTTSVPHAELSCAVRCSSNFLSIAQSTIFHPFLSFSCAISTNLSVSCALPSNLSFSCTIPSKLCFSCSIPNFTCFRFVNSFSFTSSL